MHFWWNAYTRLPSRLSATLRQHETHTYTRYDSWRLASGGLAQHVLLINDRDLAGHNFLAYFTLNFEKKASFDSPSDGESSDVLEIAISDHQFPNLESVPFCAATTLPPLELKKHTGRSAAEWAPYFLGPAA